MPRSRDVLKRKRLTSLTDLASRDPANKARGVCFMLSIASEMMLRDRIIRFVVEIASEELVYQV